MFRETDVLGYHQRTIYNDLEDAGLDWAVYFSDFPIVTFLSKTRDYPLRFKQFQEFIHDAKEGKLPQFSFLEPRWFTVAEWERSDQHPPHSTLPGELFLKDIYEALRSSPQWNQTLFIITYDENGGLYDHVLHLNCRFLPFYLLHLSLSLSSVRFESMLSVQDHHILSHI